MTVNVTVLGDSRTFDTYYTNSHYKISYGYDKTFSHIWRRLALSDRSFGYDVVNIPDHFRGGTIHNNIIRIALTDPAIVVVLDGIWETLLNKKHFIDYAERRLREYKDRDSSTLDLSYSASVLVKLFKEGELSVSPQQFAEHARKIISYFRRRQRQVIWMTLPVPPRKFIGHTYHAGDYRPIDNWDECLVAMNEAVIPVVDAYGGKIMDLTAEMAAVGGAERAFIDQWHFSPLFHAHLAQALHQQSLALIPQAPDHTHISHDYMLGSPDGDIPSEVVLYSGDEAEELEAISRLTPKEILVYPSETELIDNPARSDRAEFERQAIR